MPIGRRTLKPSLFSRPGVSFDTFLPLFLHPTAACFRPARASWGPVKAPPGDLLYDEPLLGVPPCDFVRPGAIKASPLPGGYAPGVGFDPVKHLDAEACRFPPTLTPREREAARAVERARSKPQAWERDRSAALLKLEDDRIRMEAEMQAAERRVAEAEREAQAKETCAEERTKAATALVRRE